MTTFMTREKNKTTKAIFCELINIYVRVIYMIDMQIKITYITYIYIYSINKDYDIQEKWQNL